MTPFDVLRERESGQTGDTPKDDDSREAAALYY